MHYRAIVPSLAIVLTISSVTAAQDAPVPPRDAPAKMTVPDGFRVTLFAGEPDVVQPIAFCFDDRGRLWVAECMSYPEWQADPKKGKDRILIFEDTDGDGKFDKRTVFASNLQNVSGIQYGFGGIWVCSTPNLIFIPIKEKVVTGSPDPVTVPDGPPEIVLDGWSLKAGHNVFNSLTWGPDGWLYGTNGIIATSHVGPPGTPDKDRVAINCGVWRYHPTRKKFEAVAHGTTNPWGLDFDEYGEMFITNCVIDHLWHVVPGAHYQRMYGEDLNPHVYRLMPSICDHIHWGGGNWTTSRHPSTTGKHDGDDAYKVHSDAGGGHAHVGCMIYLGDNWPDRYRGGVFMCNLHGNRINHDILERNGSTYVARHGKDFMLANDPWFRGLALHYGPDGGVYVSDWCDTGECHNYKVADKTNGRIYKVTYGEPKPFTGDLANLSDRELAKLQIHKNEWFARHARRLLQERAASRKIAANAIADLNLISRNDSAINRRLRAVWTLNAIHQVMPEDKLLEFLDDEDPNVRAWGVRLAMEQGDERHDGTVRENKPLGVIQKLARSDPSPIVRLHIASSVQRIPAEAEVGRFRIFFELLQHAEDASDPYLPLMYWYAMEPTLPRGKLAGGFVDARIPLVREFAARRITEVMDRRLDDLVSVLRRVDQPTLQRDILRGIKEGLSGRRQVRMPSSWYGAYPVVMASPLAEVRENALALAVQFGDERAFSLLRKVVPDRAQPFKNRAAALQTLLFQQEADLEPILHDLLHDQAMRRQAIRGLSSFDDPEAPKLLLQGYAKWNADERSDAVQTMSSRSSYALALLEALEKQTIPRADVSSYTIRQLQALKSPEVSAKLTKLWGEIRPASADKAKLMAKYKGELRPDVLKNANLANGRALYQKACASCHRLFGEGGDIGPDLTGSQRTNLDYVLENVLDPSAIVPREYQVTVVVTTAGRTLSGIVKKENDAAITLQMQNEQVVVPKGDIESRTPTKVSMMPEGIFEQLRIDEVRDLVAYLASPVQVATDKK
jgi:putative membrane-bound dehydrogenase-like protein